MTPTFYDTHAHLDYPDFAADLPAVLERARAAGIARIVAVGTDLASSRRVLELAEQHDFIFAAVGWHPAHASEAPADLRDPLRELGRHPKVVAIGETGLDYYHLPSRQQGSSADDDQHRRKQAALFEQHLEVAAELGLNCGLHQRDSLEAVLAQMQPWASRVRGQFHCFVNDLSALERILALGSLVSFTGILTFNNAAAVRAALAAAPHDQFMLETDCPFLAPVPYRGKRAEPAYVKEIAEVAAQVRGLSLAELSQATCATAHRFFQRLT